MLLHTNKRLYVLLIFVFGLPISQLIAQRHNMTPAERLALHARLYANPNYNSGEPYTKRSPNSQGIIHLTAGPFIDYAYSPGPPDPRAALSALAHYADAVALIKATSVAAALTSNQSFIYSDWTTTVSRVFKNYSPLPLSPGGQCVITNPGGTLKIDGVTLIAEDPGLPNLQADNTYLVFLKALPDSDSFQIIRNAFFQLSGQKIRFLSDPRYRDDAIPDFIKSLSPTEFLDIIQQLTI